MKLLLVLNWKMNPAGKGEAEKLFNSLNRIKWPKDQLVVIAPPTIFLGLLGKIKTKLSLGSQAMSQFKDGAQTGEVSASQLKSLGVKYVILNHSEQKAAGEQPETVAQKIVVSLAAGLRPVICIGEMTRDKDGLYLAQLETELRTLLSKIKKTDSHKIIIAYEPVWAVGKKATVADTPEGFHHNALFLRKVFSDKFGETPARQLVVLYGGSVNDKNARSFIEAGANGLLLGRLSLKPLDLAKVANQLVGQKPARSAKAKK
jgi:triosephosphate isomerase